MKSAPLDDAKILLGYHGPANLFPYYIPLREFSTHLYVVGTSGSGKSKFLQHILFQLVVNGAGCGLIDPHSDLIGDLLSQLDAYPKGSSFLSSAHNRNRIVFVDPSRSDSTVPCNFLISSYGSAHDTAEQVVDAFKRVWPDTLSEAPRFTQILLNTIYVLATHHLSLYEIRPFLTESGFRTSLLGGIDDDQVLSFFNGEFVRWGRDQVKFAGSVLNKVDQFLFQPKVRAMLGARENAIDVRAIMDEGKIFLLNLAGFGNGETKKLLGTLFVTAFEYAALSRESQAPAQRSPFYLVIDEFSSFVARDPTGLSDILSQCRKYRLHIGLAHQDLSQLPSDRMKGALKNAKLQIAFATGHETAAEIAQSFYTPDPKQVKHLVKDEKSQEKSHPLYQTITDQYVLFASKLVNLKRRMMYVKDPRKSHSTLLTTPTVPRNHTTSKRLQAIKDMLVKQIARPFSLPHTPASLSPASTPVSFVWDKKEKKENNL